MGRIAKRVCLLIFSLVVAFSFWPDSKNNLSALGGIIFVILIAVGQLFYISQESDVLQWIPQVAKGAERIIWLNFSLVMMGIIFFWQQNVFLALVPIVLYDLLHTTGKKFHIFVLGIFVFKILWNPSFILLEQPFWGLLIGLGIGLAYVLAYSDLEMQDVKRAYFEVRDQVVLQQTELAQAHEAILENQESQIHLAILKERNRIARDLHDSIGHTLTRSILQVGAMEIQCSDPQIQQKLHTLQQTLSSGMDEVRSNIHQIYQTSFDFEEELENVVYSFTSLKVHLLFEMGEDAPQSVRKCFLFIIKEGLTNAVRHGKAEEAWMELTEAPGFYRLKIKNKIRAMPTSQAEGFIGKNVELEKEEKAKGLGLSSMALRAEKLGGICNISATKNLFSILVTIPKTNLER